MAQPTVSIPMSAPFWSVTGEHTIAYAEQITDEVNGVQKKQSTINAEVQTALGGKADASAVTAEVAARQAADDELEDLIAAAL